MKQFVFNDRQEWLNWRLGGIGSSDAPVVMGDTRYKTRHQLWLEKRSPEYHEPGRNWAMGTGERLEPIALAKFNQWHQEEYPNENWPAVQEVFEKQNVEHEHHSFLKASLDGGLGFPPRSICEIKFQGKFNFIYQGVPDENFWQVQHGFLVTQATRGFFVGINIRQYIKVLDTAPDSQAMADLFRECEKFRWHVVNDIPPGEIL